MNAITIVVAVMCILMIAYRLYGTFMTAKVLKLNDSTPTPAHTREDGKDYVRRTNGLRSDIILPQ